MWEEGIVCVVVIMLFGVFLFNFFFMVVFFIYFMEDCISLVGFVEVFVVVVFNSFGGDFELWVMVELLVLVWLMLFFLFEDSFYLFVGFSFYFEYVY